MKGDTFLNKKKIINIFVYFLGIFALKGASFILTPLYTRVYTTAEYGTIDLANSISNLLSNIIGLGLCQYLGIEYFHFKNKERALAIEKNIKIYITISTPIILVLLGINWIGLVNISGLDQKFLTLIIMSSFLVYFSNVVLMLCKNQQKTLLMTLIQLIIGILTLALNYLGILKFSWGIYCTLITAFITNCIFIALLPLVYKFDIPAKQIKISRGEVIHVLRISIPLAITGLINSVLLIGDRWILNYYCTASEIGIYALCTKLGSIYELILINTLTIFYAPHVYKNFQDRGIKPTEEKNRKMFWLYLVIASVMAIGFIVIIKWILPLLIDNRYAESEQYLWIVLTGDIFLGAGYFRTYLVNFEKRTKIILYMNIAGMLFNIIANMIFISKYQVWAAASTTAASYILMFVIAHFANVKILKENSMK